MPPTRKAVLAAVAAGSAAVLLAALLMTVQAGPLAAPLAPDAVTAVEYASGLDDPVDITHTGLPGDERLFVVERDGRIMIVPPGGGEALSTPFLDIDILVTDNVGEQGLLGLAFSPDYATDGHFFVYYVANDGDLQLSRFSVSDNPDVALTTETPLLNIPHPDEINHNGGDLAFGPDKYLYLAPGDGGGGGDTDNSAQELDSLLGKVLRLDVTGEATYAIPATNPFVSVGGGARGEIWALGLRNPFRFAFDRLTGDLYIGDVGQGAWEEINFQPAASSGGENYGWRCYEGQHPFNLDDCGPDSDYVMPVAEYCNTSATCTTGGVAVIAGHVYRGGDNPGMQGIFFFADNGSSRFWAMQPGTWQVTSLSIGNVPNPSSFGEDLHGELYVVSLSNGKVYRLEGATAFGWQTPHFLPVISK